MADKYLNKDFVEVEGKVTSAGAGDSGKIPALDAGGKLDASLMPAGVSPQTIAVLSTQDFSAGSLVNLYYESGTLKCRKASNVDDTKPTDGFVLAGSVAGATVPVYLPGNINNQLSGLTPATYYFLSTNGAVTATEPSNSGNIIQPIGKALTTTSLLFLSTGYRKLS